MAGFALVILTYLILGVASIILWEKRKHLIENQNMYIGEYKIHTVETREQMNDFGDNVAFFVAHGDTLYLRVHQPDNYQQYHVSEHFDKNNITGGFLKDYDITYIPSNIDII